MCGTQLVTPMSCRRRQRLVSPCCRRSLRDVAETHMSPPVTPQCGAPRLREGFCVDLTAQRADGEFGDLSQSSQTTRNVPDFNEEHPEILPFVHGLSLALAPLCEGRMREAHQGSSSGCMSTPARDGKLLFWALLLQCQLEHAVRANARNRQHGPRGDWLSLLASSEVSSLRSEQNDVDDMVVIAGPDPSSNGWPKCSHRHFASILEGHCTCVSGWLSQSGRLCVGRLCSTRKMWLLLGQYHMIVTSANGHKAHGAPMASGSIQQCLQQEARRRCST